MTELQAYVELYRVKHVKSFCNIIIALDGRYVELLREREDKKKDK